MPTWPHIPRSERSGTVNALGALGGTTAQGAAETDITHRRLWPLPGTRIAGAWRIVPVMAYDQELADRIRELIAGEEGVTEQRMFGGLAFLINGNMSVAASGQGGLLVRVNPEETDAVVDDERVEPMVMRGREMRGWLQVRTEAVSDTSQLELWVARGVGYARSLPAKSPGQRR